MTIFEQFKNEYLKKALKPIHYKKLKNRINEELSAHMDDMYDDFIKDCDNELEIIKKIREEMGNATELGAELKEANKKTLYFVKALRIIVVLASIPVLYCCLSLGIFLFDEMMVYFHAETAPEIEAYIVEEYNNSNPINLLTEFEHNNVVHRIYIPKVQGVENFEIFHIHSIEILGFNVKNRFEHSSCYYAPNSNYTMASLDQHPIRDELLIYFNKPDYKYMKVKFISDNAETSDYWSDFIEIPQDATIDNPKYFVLDCPDGYRWSYYKTYDENKEPIEYK